jgi:hypothetical protein
MTDSSRETLADRETELDLLQRRLHDKTNRAVRVIQFNIVALSVLAGLTQLVGFSNLLSSPTVIVGVGILIFSTALSVAGITLNGIAFGWVENNDKDEIPEIESTIYEYRERNNWLSRIMPISLVSGGASVAIILLGLLRTDGVSAWGSLWGLGVAMIVSLVGAAYVGFELAQRIRRSKT